MRRRILGLSLVAVVALTGLTGLAACGSTEAPTPKTVLTSAPPLPTPVQQQTTNVAPDSPICIQVGQTGTERRGICNDLMSAIVAVQDWMNKGGPSTGPLFETCKEYWTSAAFAHVQQELANHRSANDAYFNLSIIMESANLTLLDVSDGGHRQAKVLTVEKWQVAKRTVGGYPILDTQPENRNITYTLRFDENTNHYEVFEMIPK